MKHKTLIFLAFGLIIMAIMLWFIGIDQVLRALTIANPLYVALAILLQVFSYFLFTLRWQFINHITDKDFSFKRLLPMVIVSLSVNNITPSGRGGGEPVRAYLLTKEAGDPFSETFATVIADRALDTFPFVILAIITIVGLMTQLTLPPAIIIVMIIAVIGIIIAVSLLIFMSINEAFGIKITKWISNLAIKILKKRDPEVIKNKIESAVEGFQSTMRIMTSDKRMIYYALPLSFIIWIVEVIRVYVVFVAFGCTVSPIIIGEVFIVASLVGMIPLLPGGLGAIDGFMILLYSSSGISPSTSAAATVIERLISFWMTTIIGLLILPMYGDDVFDKISSLISDNKNISEAEEELLSEENNNEK